MLTGPVQGGPSVLHFPGAQQLSQEEKHGEPLHTTGGMQNGAAAAENRVAGPQGTEVGLPRDPAVPLPGGQQEELTWGVGELLARPHAPQRCSQQPRNPLAVHQPMSA